MLVLLTHAYPYGEGEIFLEQELPFLLEEFSSISIIPLFSKGTPRKTPKGVEVIPIPEEGMIKKVARSCLETNTYKEMKKRPETLFSVKKLQYLLGYTSYCHKLYQFLHSQIHTNPEWREALFYTYWFHVQASALAKLKTNHFPDLKIVSRAHGYDIYEEEYWPGYIPMRQYTTSALNHIFAVSQDGNNYLAKKWHLPSEKISVSRIGTKQPTFQATPSDSNQLVIVSCSHMVPEKRIEQMIYSIAHLEKLCDRNVYWHHFGDGPLYNDLYKLAESVLPPDVQWKFHGKVTNAQIFEWYQNNPVDVFVSTSRTEGIPVSMMEAASCGIPIVATDVGGVREIVCEKNGSLFPRDACPEDIAKALIHATDPSKRVVSIKKWKTTFSMDTNYRSFTQTLRAISNSK